MFALNSILYGVLVAAFGYGGGGALSPLERHTNQPGRYNTPGSRSVAEATLVYYVSL
jgi:hypothetical protein